MSESYNCFVRRNMIVNSSMNGIELWNSENCTISNNQILNNSRNGIRLAINNTQISGNLIKNNTCGINSSDDTTNNIIFKNAFVDNGIHAWDESTSNSWNNSISGNYWDNYTGNDRGDGIGDIPYTYILGSGNSNDSYPLIQSPLHNGSKIHIDDSGVSAENWSAIVKTKAWCTGSGSYGDPYIIDELEINGSRWDL